MAHKINLDTCNQVWISMQIKKIKVFDINIVIKCGRKVHP